MYPPCLRNENDVHVLLTLFLSFCLTNFTNVFCTSKIVQTLLFWFKISTSLFILLKDHSEGNKMSFANFTYTKVLFWQVC